MTKHYLCILNLCPGLIYLTHQSAYLYLDFNLNLNPVPKPPGDIFLIQATAETLDIGWGPALNFVGEYEITYTPESGDQPVRTSPQDRELFLEGLQLDTEYEFTIVNTVGEGEFKTDSEPEVETFRTSK